MNSKQRAEVEFWKHLYQSLGEKGFTELRKKDLAEKTKFFDGLMQEKGLGVDIGCGCRTIFEYSELQMIAIDPLLDEYGKFCPITDCPNVKYINSDCEELPFTNEYFDFAVCVNVIDHTPNPQKMADEIIRTLKPGGKLYFEVNFDDSLHAPHYSLWNEELVKKTFEKMKLLSSKIERNDVDRQYLYHAIYQKYEV